MFKIQTTFTARMVRRRACKALIRRGRDFMRFRQAFVGDRDCLPSMIMACIAEGAQSRDDIVRNVPRFVGHSYREVAAVLDQFCGPSADEHYWYCDAAKTYHLHIATRRRSPPVELRIGSVRRRKAKPKPLLPDVFF